MVFVGTALGESVQPARVDRDVPSVALRFRVDRAIVGVEPGQILTIREWTAVWTMQRQIRPGEHLLLFLYPPSRLGLTSPVGGTRGQIRIDAAGRYIKESVALTPVHMGDANRSNSPPSLSGTPLHSPVTIDQLERAIRTARGE